MKKIKLILDTNIFFSAFVFDKRILKLLDYCFENFEIYSSNNILKEIEIVLFRKKTVDLIKNFDVIITQKFIDKIVSDSIFVNSKLNILVCRDPKDNMFLELASESKADFIITGDADLLVVKKFEDCKILTPSQFIDLLSLKI